MNNPMEQAPDDQRCAWCRRTLPPDPEGTTWAFLGFCDAACALRLHIEQYETALFFGNRLIEHAEEETARALDEVVMGFRLHQRRGK